MNEYIATINYLNILIMTSVLCVHFNTNFETLGNHDFEIYNPIVLPAEGESVNFEWTDFLNNAALIKELESFGENNIWICNILFKKYYKDRVETHIVLMDQKSYEQFADC